MGLGGSVGNVYAWKFSEYQNNHLNKVETSIIMVILVSPAFQDSLIERWTATMIIDIERIVVILGPWLPHLETLLKSFFPIKYFAIYNVRDTHNS